jgi:proteasome assembly chaperone (PAC2) family protein
MSWIIQKKFTKKPHLKNPILIEGLPGIGSVGKIAVDFMIDKLKPVLLYKIYSHEFPHSVYLTENSFVELPSVSLYYVKNKNRDILLLAGDAQPYNIRRNRPNSRSQKIKNIWCSYKQTSSKNLQKNG